MALFKEKPSWQLMSVALLVALCSSLQNGYVSSVLNIPQKIVEQFVNVSSHDQTGVYLSPDQSTMIWSLLIVQRQIGQLIGTFMSPFLCGWLGRKGTIIFNTIPLGLGLIMQTISNYVNVWELLLLGRLVWSIGCGIVAVIIPMFLSEIAPNDIRGGVASIHGLMIGLGSLTADFAGLPMILGTVNDWSLEYVIVLGLQVVQLIAMPFLYESPKDLYIRQHKTEKSVTAMKFYHRKHNEEDIDELLREYENEKQAGQTLKNPLKALWSQPELRMSVLVGIGATGCYAFGGMQIITTYTTEIFESTGVPDYVAEYCSLGVGALRFFAVFPSMYIVEKFGRRPLLLFSLGGCIVCFCLMAIAQLAYEHHPSYWPSVLIVIATLAYGFLFSIGCQTIGTFLPSELVPTQQRAANQSVAVAMRFIIALITTFIFLPLQRSIGGFCYLELIIPLVITFWFMWRCMPETKDRDIVDILNEMNTYRNVLTKVSCKHICCPSGKDYHLDEGYVALMPDAKSDYGATDGNTPSLELVNSGKNQGNGHLE